METYARATLEEMRKYAEAKRSTHPVYWGEFLRTMDRNFNRPDDKEYRKWLAKFQLTEDWAWGLTDSYVTMTRSGRTECYPVILGATVPVRCATPVIPDAVRKGHLLLGFVTDKWVGTHPDSDIGEPEMAVDEAFALDCWDKTQVEPMLRGCFLYG